MSNRAEAVKVATLVASGRFMGAETARQRTFVIFMCR